MCVCQKRETSQILYQNSFKQTQPFTLSPYKYLYLELPYSTDLFFLEANHVWAFGASCWPIRLPQNKVSIPWGGKVGVRHAVVHRNFAYQLVVYCSTSLGIGHKKWWWVGLIVVYRAVPTCMYGIALMGSSILTIVTSFHYWHWWLEKEIWLMVTCSGKKIINQMDAVLGLLSIYRWGKLGSQSGWLKNWELGLAL